MLFIGIIVSVSVSVCAVAVRGDTAKKENDDTH